MSSYGEGEVILACYGIEDKKETNSSITITAFSNLQPRDQDKLIKLGWDRITERVFKYNTPSKMMPEASSFTIPKFIESDVDTE